MVVETQLEERLFEVGRRLWDALPAATRNPLKAADDKAMELASQDAELKAALFRFVDVVPACRSLDDLARHLTGFLGEVERPPPASSTWRTASSSARARAPRSARCASCGRTASPRRSTCSARRRSRRPRRSATPPAAPRR